MLLELQHLLITLFVYRFSGFILFYFIEISLVLFLLLNTFDPRTGILDSIPTLTSLIIGYLYKLRVCINSE